MEERRVSGAGEPRVMTSSITPKAAASFAYGVSKNAQTESQACFPPGVCGGFEEEEEEEEEEAEFEAGEDFV